MSFTAEKKQNENALAKCKCPDHLRTGAVIEYHTSMTRTGITGVADQRLSFTIAETSYD
tara:strand:+ start:354 stop:530 length:177 start_codon:yes stop_codon:yes gene_type:complete